MVRNLINCTLPGSSDLVMPGPRAPHQFAPPGGIPLNCARRQDTHTHIHACAARLEARSFVSRPTPARRHPLLNPQPPASQALALCPLGAQMPRARSQRLPVSCHSAFATFPCTRLSVSCHSAFATLPAVPHCLAPRAETSTTTATSHHEYPAPNRRQTPIPCLLCSAPSRRRPRRAAAPWHSY